MNPSDTALNRDDRDMIIGLNVKVDRLITDVRDIKDDSSVRISKLETRIDQIDNYHSRIDLQHFQDNNQWIDRVRANLSLMLTLGGVMLATAGGLISSLLIKYLKI